MKKFKKAIKADSDIPESRVVQISLDVELHPNVDADEVIEEFKNAATNSSRAFNILGADVTEDLTELYESQYPDLLRYRGL